jgi:hypothetical protein
MREMQNPFLLARGVIHKLNYVWYRANTRIPLPTKRIYSLGVVHLRALLDTHALLWWLSDDAALTRPARRIIAETRNTLIVSAVFSR